MARARWYLGNCECHRCVLVFLPTLGPPWIHPPLVVDVVYAVSLEGERKEALSNDIQLWEDTWYTQENT